VSATGTDSGQVVITNKDIYEKVTKMEGALAVLMPQVPDHETRLRALERWRYALPTSLVMGGAGLVVAVIRHG
jgi:hypothetical protein